MIALTGCCQQEDGCLNTCFTVKKPENRRSNLLECHELYCAGHLIEAAVAMHEALGKYLWSEGETTVYSRLFIGSEAKSAHGRISLESGYPWAGCATYALHDGGAFTLAIHILAHVHKPCIRISGNRVAYAVEDGYCRLHHTWQPGDMRVWIRNT